MLSICLSDWQPSDGEAPIKAVLAQTCENWQLLISPKWNQSSLSQGLGAIPTDDRIKFVEAGDDYYAGLNNCLQQAEGAHIKFLHPAEVLMPNAVEQLQNEISKHPTLALLRYQTKLSDEVKTGDILLPDASQFEIYGSEVNAQSICDLFAGVSIYSVCAKNMQLAFDRKFYFLIEQLFLKELLTPQAAVVDCPMLLSEVKSKRSSNINIPFELSIFLLSGELILHANELYPEHYSRHLRVERMRRWRKQEEEKRQGVTANSFENGDEVRSDWGDTPIAEILQQIERLSDLANKSHIISFVDFTVRQRLDLAQLSPLMLRYALRVLTAFSYDRMLFVEDERHKDWLCEGFIAELKESHQYEEAEITALLGSRSWRLLEPIRSAKQKIVGLRRFLNKV